MANKKNSNKPNKISKDTLIEKTLRRTGFLLPETAEEVKEFERLYGTTDVILPPELQDLYFLHFKKTNAIEPIVVNISTKVAMAAREGKEGLSEEIRIKMESDRRKADKKVKGRNK